MRKLFKTLPASALLALAAWAGPLQAQEEGTDAFGSLVEQIQSDIGSASDQAILDFLRQAKEMNRFFAADLVMKDYFARNFNPSGPVLLAAAENAQAAGLFANAATYYRRYLKDASPSPESGAIAAELYNVLINLQNREEDAYAHMVATELRFRGESSKARQFDAWFLRQARERGDFAALALGLKRIFADNPSRGLKHQYAWPALRDAMARLRNAKADQAKNVEIFKGLIDSSGLSEGEKNQFRFYVALYDYRRLVEAKGEKEAGSKLGALLQAAGAYVSSSKSASALVDAARSIALHENGRDFDEKKWRANLNANLKFVVGAFNSLPKDQQVKFINVRIHRNHAPMDLGRPAEWFKAGARNELLFRHWRAWEYRADQLFDLSSGDINKSLAEMTKIVGNSDSGLASIVRSLNAGNDVKSVADHFFGKESWYLNDREISSMWRNSIEDSLRWKIGGNDKKKRDGAISAKAWIDSAGKWFASSPLLVNDRDMTRHYLEMAWRAAGNDKTAAIPHFQALAWIPFNSREVRQRGIKDFYSNSVRKYFDSWAHKLRKDKKRMKPEEIATAEAAIKVRGKVEGVINALISEQGINVDSAPNPVAKAYASLLAAGGDVGKWSAAAGPVVEHLANFKSAKTPFARVYFRGLLERTSKKSHVADFQVAAFDSLLANWQGEQDPIVQQILEDAFRARRDWPTNIRSEQRADALKVNQVLGKHLTRLFNAGVAPRYLWDRFVQTRRGRGWHDTNANSEVCELALQKDLFPKLYEGKRELGTVSAMYMINREFPGLKKKFDVASAFDDKVVAEAKAKQFMHLGYWDNGGKDKDGKVAKAAAEIFAAYEVLPTIKGTSEYRYEAEEFGRLDWRIFGESGKKIDDAQLDAVTAKFGSRYDSTAMGNTWFARKPDIKNGAVRSQFFERLKAYMGRMGQTPFQAKHPNMSSLAEMQADEFSDDEFDTLVALIIEHPFRNWSGWNGSEDLARIVIDGLAKRERYDELLKAAPHLWRAAGDLRRQDLYGKLTSVATKLASDEDDASKKELAASLASSGLAVAKSGMEDATKRQLSLITSKVHVATGRIPVGKGDPAYPIYLAQQSWRVKREAAAWEAYKTPGANGVLSGMFEKIDPKFVTWLVAEHTRRKQLDEAEGLVRNVLTWMDDLDPGAIDGETRAGILLAQADIAFARREFPLARSKYQYIAEAEEFARLQAQLLALLKMADTDRETKRYDTARDILNRLARRPDTYVNAMAYYYLAKVSVDEENIEEAHELISKSIDLYEDNDEARLLQGEIQKLRRNYIEARSLEIGSSAQRTKMIPGDPLTLRLRDRNRALAGRESTIELSVWTDKTKDKETVLLAQIGETGDLFEATIDTMMGAASENDGILQVLGNDRVYFDMSEDFKLRTNYTGEDTQRMLKVHSDAELYASSSEIQTKAELEQQRLREEIASKAGIDLGRKGPQWEEENAIGVALSQTRPLNEVRPGNPFNLRVIGLDMNYTDQIDSVTVDVKTTSGDEIKGLSLNESDAYSGSFEGQVITAKRPAYAIASDSRVGNDPNAVVSPNKSGDLPPWIGQALDNKAKRFIAIDLNDYVMVGKTTAIAEPGHALKGVIVQTSLNNRNFTTVGSWPEQFTPWDGKLQVDIVPSGLPSAGRGGDSYAATTDLFDVDYLAAKSGRERVTPASGSFVIDYDSDLKAAWEKVSKKVGKPAGNDRRAAQPMVSVRVRGAFWVPQRQTRTFYLLGGQASSEGRRSSGGPTLYINGRQVNSTQGRRGGGGETEGPQGFPFELIKGLHVMELVYQVPANQGSAASVAVKINTSEPPYTAEVDKEFFNLAAVPPAVMEEFLQKPVGITPEGDNLTLDFAGTGTRVVKFWITDFDGDAPGLRQVQMQNAKGEQVLPIANDYTELRENDTLEIAPGDTVTVTYKDPHPYNDSATGVHQANMQATYNNGTISAAFVTFNADGEEAFHGVRRFDIGDTVKVFVRDNDLDTSDSEDKTIIKIASSEGKSLSIPAIETGPHTGIFRGTFFPVSEPPQEGKVDQIQVSATDDLSLSYQDKENTEPGIPWKREALVEQAIWVDPEFRVYGSKSESLPADELAAMSNRNDEEKSEGERGDVVQAQYRLIVERPGESLQADQPGEGVSAILGGPILAEITWPTVCKSTNSQLTIYAQTKTGREMSAEAGGTAGGVFDLDVPGTIELTSGPRAPSAGREGLPQAYLEALVVGNEMAAAPMDAGTFGFSLPVIQGDCPKFSLVGEGAERIEEYGLYVTATDEIYIGFKYEDQSGQERWFTQTVRLTGDALFDVMDRRYENMVVDRYVGEQAFLRVIDPMRNTSGEKDEIEVTVKTESGHEATVTLKETLSHSGIFKGLVEFIHSDDKAGLEDAVLQNGLPVAYGDKVTLTYQGAGIEFVRDISISKGADGDVLPFTKKFKDPEIAMRTIFSIAEAYFEMAKKHRILADEAESRDRPAEAKKMQHLAREEIKQGRKLLNEAIRDFPENQIRAQADYLRAELSLELAKDTQLESKKEEYYKDALRLFGDILARYSDSEYAPKAQFKKALVYEKMGEMDLACAEYVKLSYKYPGNELIAETIARLGNYFLTQGDTMNKAADEEKDQIAAADKRLQAKEMFTTAGRVFSKLKEHFPEHNLAAQTTVAAGMCMMWGERWQDAHDLLTSVIDDGTVTKPETKAEAFYWLGDTYVRMIGSRDATIKVKGSGQAFDAASWAYQTFTKLTWEYPETKWARFARGQLAGNEALQAPQ